jgi:hypothetical protein
MRKLILAGVAIAAMAGNMSCKQNCDGNFPQSQQLIINVVNKSTKFALLRYSGGVVPDSIKLTNIATNQRLNMFAGGGDTLLFSSDYTYQDGAVDVLKLQIGSRKPDTITITAKKEFATDCSDGYSYFRLQNFKVNNVLQCTDCSREIVRIEK